MKPLHIFKVALCLLCCLNALNGISQTTINSAGHSATINGMTFDYSIGEMTLISTEKTSNLIITQGLLQPSHSESTTHDQANDQVVNNFIDNLKVYPNPTDNLLFIETTDALAGEFSYQLLDASGKIVLKNKSQQQNGSNKYSLNLTALAAGSYFLMVSQTTADGINNNTSYKIQKTK